MNIEPNHIYCGDALLLLSKMKDNSVPMVLTDIPYTVVNRESAGIREFDKKDADEETFPLAPFIRELVRVCSGSIYVFCATEQVSELRKGFVELGLTTRLGIWEKTDPSPVNGEHLWLSGIETCVFARKAGATFNYHCYNPVWRFPSGKSTEHPTEKSQSLFEHLILASSNEGDVVLDPCAGSCTTAAAALKEKRQFICFDISEEYCRLGEHRVAANQQNVIFAAPPPEEPINGELQRRENSHPGRPVPEVSHGTRTKRREKQSWKSNRCGFED